MCLYSKLKVTRAKGTLVHVVRCVSVRTLSMLTCLLVRYLLLSLDSHPTLANFGFSGRVCFRIVPHLPFKCTLPLFTSPSQSQSRIGTAWHSVRGSLSLLYLSIGLNASFCILSLWLKHFRPDSMSSWCLEIPTRLERYLTHRLVG